MWVSLHKSSREYFSISIFLLLWLHRAVKFWRRKRLIQLPLSLAKALQTLQGGACSFFSDYLYFLKLDVWINGGRKQLKARNFRRKLPLTSVSVLQSKPVCPCSVVLLVMCLFIWTWLIWRTNTILSIPLHKHLCSCEFLDCLWFVMRLGDSSIIV